MKRLLIALFIISLAALQASAQKYYTSDPSGSIIFAAGFNNSSLLTDTADHASIKTPFAGLMYNHVISERFNLNMGVSYIAKGYKNEKLHMKHRYFYAEMPVYLQYKLGDDIRFDIGAQYSLFTNATTTYLDGDKDGGQNSIHDNIALKRTDPSAMLGAELKISDSFDLAARYTRSFSSFKKELGFSSFQLQLHYRMISFYGHGRKKEDAPQN
jgi:hypothetical protein